MDNENRSLEILKLSPFEKRESAIAYWMLKMLNQLLPEAEPFRPKSLEEYLNLSKKEKVKINLNETPELNEYFVKLHQAFYFNKYRKEWLEEHIEYLIEEHNHKQFKNKIEEFNEKTNRIYNLIQYNKSKLMKTVKEQKPYKDFNEYDNAQ